jgi:hypothetical protein
MMPIESIPNDADNGDRRCWRDGFLEVVHAGQALKSTFRIIPFGELGS